MMRLLLLICAIALGGCVTFPTAKAVATPTYPITWDVEDASRTTVTSAPVPAPARSVGGLVAILPLDTQEANLDAAARGALEELVRTVAGDALKPRGYTVLTGETTLGVLGDNGVDAAKACDTTCALTMARELKATLFLSGSVTRTEGQLIAFVRLFDVATGQQLGSVHLEGASARDLRVAFESRASEFFTKALGAPGT